VPADLKRIEQLAARLVAREPASLPTARCWLWRFLRQGRLTEALEVYKEIDVPQPGVERLGQRVQAAVLAANSRTDDAKS